LPARSSCPSDSSEWRLQCQPPLVGSSPKALGHAALLSKDSCPELPATFSLVGLRRHLVPLRTDTSRRFRQADRAVLVSCPAVIVLGASGQVGLFSLASLLHGGREVIAITRNEQAGKGTGIERLRRCTMRQLSARLRENGDSAGSELALLSCGPMALAREMLETTQMGSDRALRERRNHHTARAGIRLVHRVLARNARDDDDNANRLRAWYARPRASRIRWTSKYFRSS
jgi:hypothetical protein